MSVLINGMEMPKVVRCKNCKYHIDIDEESGMVYCPEIIGGWVKNDSFCAVWDGKPSCRAEMRGEANE